MVYADNDEKMYSVSLITMFFLKLYTLGHWLLDFSLVFSCSQVKIPRIDPLHRFSHPKWKTKAFKDLLEMKSSNKLCMNM